MRTVISSSPGLAVARAGPAFVTRPPITTLISFALPSPVNTRVARAAGRAGFKVELADREPDASMFSIRPGPHPSPLLLKIPGLDATTLTANGLLGFPATVTVSELGPSGADRGMSALIRLGKTATTLTGSAGPFRDNATVVLSAGPKRTP